MGYDKCLLGGRVWQGDQRQQGEGLDRSIQGSAMFEFLVSEVDDGCDVTPASVEGATRSASSRRGTCPMVRRRALFYAGYGSRPRTSGTNRTLSDSFFQPRCKMETVILFGVLSTPEQAYNSWATPALLDNQTSKLSNRTLEQRRQQRVETSSSARTAEKDSGG